MQRRQVPTTRDAFIESAADYRQPTPALCSRLIGAETLVHGDNRPKARLNSTPAGRLPLLAGWSER